VTVTDWVERETRYEYDKNGRLISETRPNGTQMTRRYNVAGQLVQQVEKDNHGELINQFDFSYDAAGNILKEQKLPKPDSVSLPPVTMTYSAANRLATYNGQAVSFDADGNMVSGPLSGEMANFSFDSQNRLVQAGSTSYRYDADNQRIGVNQTSYLINSQLALSQVLVKEENGVKTFYVYGLGLIGEEKDGEYRSYHFDFRGSTVALTDKTGKVVDRFQYGPYGELVKGDAAVTPFLFNGKYGVMTDDNGLYYMRARFYSPAMKRFVNQDVLLGNLSKGQTLNRFAFVTGRPVSLVDPWGLSAKDMWDGAVDGFFGAVGGAAVAFLIISTLPVSAPVMTAIAIVASGTGGFVMGVKMHEVYTRRNYWSGTELTSSEVDYRKGHLLIDVGALGAGCTWFRIRSPDSKALSDWEWLNLSPRLRRQYEVGLSTVSDAKYREIGDLPPELRGLTILDTDWKNAFKNISSGPGPAGRYAWPFSLPGAEACQECASPYFP
jgi:RHS repeat-associated protein